MAELNLDAISSPPSWVLDGESESGDIDKIQTAGQIWQSAVKQQEPEGIGSYPAWRVSVDSLRADLERVRLGEPGASILPAAFDSALGVLGDQYYWISGGRSFTTDSATYQHGDRSTVPAKFHETFRLYSADYYPLAESVETNNANIAGESQLAVDALQSIYRELNRFAP